jgi:hypothetical protein
MHSEMNVPTGEDRRLAGAGLNDVEIRKYFFPSVN